MEDVILECIRSINLSQLICIGLMLWFVYSRLDNKMEKMKEEMKELKQEIHNLDKRLCRIEGILHTQDCCAIKASNDLRKAE